jgi:hypothetical protein
MFSEEAASGLAPSREFVSMEIVAGHGARPVDIDGGIEASTD